MTVRRAALEEILPLRHAELRPGRPMTTAAFDGDDEPTTVHVAAVDDSGDVVCCATLVRRPLDDRPALQLRGMATRHDRARQGIGTAVVRFVEALAATEGIGLLWCNARTGAAAFYERLGWCVVSAPFDIPDVGPHVRMEKALG